MKIDTTTVSKFELGRYLGKWYEIARFDHPFERGLEGVMAEYLLRPDGKITVVNSGHRGSPTGPLRIARGKAKMSVPEVPGRLRVSFFLWFYGDYNIMELTEDYGDYLYLTELSADAVPVLASEGNYEFLCGRTDHMPRYFERMRKETEKTGVRTFNLSRYLAKRALERTPQP